MSFGRFSSLFALFAVVLGIFSSAPAYAQNRGIDPQVWPEAFFQNASSRIDEVGVRFTNAIFDGSTGTDLFNDHFGNTFSMGVSVQRDIYNNFDLLNTWTVIDRLKIRSSIRFLGLGDTGSLSGFDPHAVGSLAFPFFGLSAGTEQSIEWRDVRQMEPNDVQNLERIEKTKEAVEQCLKGIACNALVKAPGSAPDSEADLQDVNPYLNSINGDVTARVKLKNILNPLTMPFRMPLSRRDLRKMQKGEVISYTLQGKAIFAGNIGFSVVPNPTIDVGAAIGFETHLEGDFEVSVLKENERYAKVRVSKVRGKGIAGQFKVAVDFNRIYQGFFVFNQRVGEVSLQVIPFKFEVAEDFDHEFDVGYRYDLESEEGRDAFHRAVLGSLAVSEKIAQDDATSAAPAVEKLYSRKTDWTVQRTGHSSDLSLLFFRRRDLKTEDLSAALTLPNGTQHIFRSLESDERHASDIRGNAENGAKKISVMVDEEGFESGKPGSVLVIGEAIMEDFITSGEELNSYANEIESMFNIPGRFPRFPERVARRNGNGTKRAWYGKSSFYYGFTLHEAEIHHFLSKDEAEIEKLAATYGVKFNPVAFRQAKVAYSQKHAIPLYQGLKEMFSDRKHVRNLMQFLLASLDGMEYEHFLVGQNESFGSIQDRGKQLSVLERIFQETSDTMGMGADTARSVPNPESVVTHISSRITDDHKVEVEFTLARRPQFLFFRVDPLTGKHHRKKVQEVVIYNRHNRFHVGVNRLVLDPTDSDVLIHKLTQKLEANRYVMFTMGYSEHGAAWGPGTSTEFTTPVDFPENQSNR